MASQILIMAATRCMCCVRALRTGCSRAWAIVLFITCWVTSIIAEVCLLAGSVRNAYHTKYKSIVSDPSLVEKGNLRNRGCLHCFYRRNLRGLLRQSVIYCRAKQLKPATCEVSP